MGFVARTVLYLMVKISCRYNDAAPSYAISSGHTTTFTIFGLSIWRRCGAIRLFSRLVSGLFDHKQTVPGERCPLRQFGEETVPVEFLRKWRSQFTNKLNQRLEADDSYSQIAAACSVSCGTVENIAVRKFPGRIGQKAGGPLKLTQRQKLFCANLITSKQNNNALEVQKLLRNDQAIEVQ